MGVAIHPGFADALERLPRRRHDPGRSLAQAVLRSRTVRPPCRVWRSPAVAGGKFTEEFRAEDVVMVAASGALEELLGAEVARSLVPIASTAACS